MRREYTIAGPLNSGTNIIEKILEKCYGLDVIHKDVKHTLRKPTLVYRQQINPNLTYIIMYKNIYNWIASIQKYTYDIKFYDLKSGGSVLDAKNIRYRQENFSNIIEIYNKYYSTYMSMYNDHKYNMIFIDYYRLINGKDGEYYLLRKLHDLDTHIQKNEDEFIKILNEPSKIHGHSVMNFTEALEKRDRLHNLYRCEVVEKNLSRYIQNDLYEKIERLCV